MTTPLRTAPINKPKIKSINDSDDLVQASKAIFDEVKGFLKSEIIKVLEKELDKKLKSYLDEYEKQIKSLKDTYESGLLTEVKSLVKSLNKGRRREIEYDKGTGRVSGMVEKLLD